MYQFLLNMWVMQKVDTAFLQDGYKGRIIDRI